MKGLKTVHKHLDENVDTLVKYRLFGGKRPNVSFTKQRAKFCKTLRNNGYKTLTKGNYIIATNGSEHVTFYFTAHCPYNRNYLIAATLENEVNYFAFYDNDTNNVYLVGYGIVRQYCKTLRTAYMFYNKNRRLFIPDEWAKQQQINTYYL